jgi:LuxR family maltose regulon positive regulatory protein
VGRQPPQFRRAIIERKRLLATLAGAQERRVVLLCAPAGFGKTIVAAQLSQSDPRPSCWVQIEDTDNDPIVFLHKLVDMLEQLGPISARLAHELESPAPRVQKVVLPLVREQLGNSDPPLVVVDDAERLNHPGSLAMLAFLVAELPFGSQLVLATRSEPEIGLARLRAAGEILDLGTADLALDVRETRALLDTAGLKPSDEQVRAIHHRAEGWAAGIALAMLSPAGLFSGQDLLPIPIEQSPAVAAYLVEEAVAHQPPDVRHFLLASSPLQRMSPALCDAALQIANSGRLLTALARTNVFILRGQEDGEWYRYHELFRDLLQMELRRQAPEFTDGVMRRAAAWHEQHGDPAEAFEYAHACGDLAGAGRVAFQSVDRFLAHGRVGKLRTWLARCTPQEMASDPHLALAGAWIALMSGDTAEARRLTVASGEAGDLDAPSASGATSLRSSLAILRATIGDDGVSQMRRDGEFVVAAEARGGTMWATHGWHAVGTANLLQGQPADAIAAFAEAVAMTRDHPEVSFVALTCLGYSALAATDMGDWRRARKWARDAHALANERGLGHIVHSVPPYIAHATVLHHDGLIAQAAKALEHVRRMLPKLHAMRWAEADISLRCADLSLDSGDVESALELADVARDALAHYPDPGMLLARLEALETRLRRGRELELTPSELRLAPFLSSHLTLQEIGDRMYLSRATIKTHTDSIYRKLEACTRSQAVQRLEALGLLDRQPALARRA